MFRLQDDIQPADSCDISLEAAKFAFVRGPTWYKAEQSVRDALDLAAKKLEAAGSTVEHVELPPDFDRLPE